MSLSVNVDLFSQLQLCQWETMIPQGKVSVHWDMPEDGWVKPLRLSTTCVCKSLLFQSSRYLAQPPLWWFYFLNKNFFWNKRNILIGDWIILEMECRDGRVAVNLTLWAPLSRPASLPFVLDTSATNYLKTRKPLYYDIFSDNVLLILGGRQHACAQH